jgi:hypothetical protein
MLRGRHFVVCLLAWVGGEPRADRGERGLNVHPSRSHDQLNGEAPARSP